MEWISLVDEQELEMIKGISAATPILIFKHSTRCPISSTALGRIERAWNNEEMKDIKTYFLDLITYRPVSNRIEEIFNIRHQSPQVLIIKNGECIYHASHLEISYLEINKIYLPLKN